MKDINSIPNDSKQITIKYSEDNFVTFEQMRSTIEDVFPPLQGKVCGQCYRVPHFLSLLNMISNIVFFTLCILYMFVKPNVSGPFDQYITLTFKEFFLKYKRIIMCVAFLVRSLIITFKDTNVFEIKYQDKLLYKLKKTNSPPTIDEVCLLISKTLDYPYTLNSGGLHRKSF
ncbi:hypothetical protein WA158_003652 [Blastocystis sp. Blastoise]